jgi:hypothetical protein
MKRTPATEIPQPPALLCSAWSATAGSTSPRPRWTRSSGRPARCATGCNEGGGDAQNHSLISASGLPAASALIQARQRSRER